MDGWEVAVSVSSSVNHIKCFTCDYVVGILITGCVRNNNIT